MVYDVHLRLRGLMVERFLQRALEEGVELRNVRRQGLREAHFSATQRGAQKLLALAEAYKLDISVQRRTGLARLRDRFCERPALLLSLVLCLALVSLFLNRLWLIEIPKDAEPEVRSALMELGVYPGMALRSIDTRALEEELHALTGKYAFIGARLDGVRLKISAVEELPEPELYALSSARDLVASRDAILVTINTFTGEAAAKAGDTVRRGQVLIRGEEKVSDEVSHGVCALGEAIGRVWVSGEATGQLSEWQQQPTGRVSLSSELRLLDYTIPLAHAGAFEREWVSVQRLPVGGLYLPLQIVRTLHEEVAPSQKQLDIEAVKAELGRAAMDMARSKLPQNAEIVDKWTDYSMIEGDQICARAVIETRQNVAVSRSALALGGN